MTTPATTSDATGSEVDGVAAGEVAPAAGADGAAASYRAGATLSVRTEARRQLTRRRTQIALGLMLLLPVILMVAFKLGSNDDDNNDGQGAFGLVDIATSGGLNFTLFTLFVSSSFLLVVTVALFCGDTVASEASWGSLRYLLAVPVPRARLLAVKLVVSLAYCVLAFLLLAGSAVLVGALAFGWHPLQMPLGGELAPGTGLLRLVGVLGYMALTLLTVAGLAFLLSVSTDAPLGAVGGAVMLYIASNILDAVTALGDIRNVLPTRYNNAWLGLLSSPLQTDDMLSGAISALTYGTVFFALAWYRFLSKDVVS